MKRKILLIVLTVCALFMFSMVSLAQTLSDSIGGDVGSLHVMDVWSVDSGKHLDWSGSTVYSSNFITGVNTWNSYKNGVIRQDTILTLNDITISDVSYIDDNTIALTIQYGLGKSSSSTIQFATTKMNALSSDLQRNLVCTHELGHALGLDENNTSGTNVIMYNIISQNTSGNILHNQDKLNYDYMYNYRY